MEVRERLAAPPHNGNWLESQTKVGRRRYGRGKFSTRSVRWSEKGGDLHRTWLRQDKHEDTSTLYLHRVTILPPVCLNLSSVWLSAVKKCSSGTQENAKGYKEGDKRDGSIGLEKCVRWDEWELLESETYWKAFYSAMDCDDKIHIIG